LISTIGDREIKHGLSTLPPWRLYCSQIEEPVWNSVSGTLRWTELIAHSFTVVLLNSNDVV